MVYEILSLYLFSMVIIVLFWTAYIRATSDSKFSKMGFLLGLAVSTYMFGYVMEINAHTRVQILFWNKIEYLGIPFVSALWMNVGLVFTGNYYFMRKRILVAIYGIPFITLVLRFTNNYHSLYFKSVVFISKNDHIFMIKENGIWKNVQMVHSMTMIFITLFVFIYDSIKCRNQEKGKMMLMMGASFFGVSGLLLSRIRPFDLVIDYMVVCLPAACVFIIIAIIKYDFLETKSLARNKYFEVSEDAILLINKNEKIIDFNTQAVEIFEKCKLHLVEGYINDVFSERKDILEATSSDKTIILKLEDEKEYYFEVSTKKLYDSKKNNTGSLKRFRDITTVYQMNKLLKQQALLDELSGLVNRRGLMKEGLKQIREARILNKKVYLLMFDIDYFKRVNDQYGHQMGDEVIKSVGRVLKECFFEGNLIARIGGEEFVALAYGYQFDEIQEKAKTILKCVKEKEFVCKDKKFHITVSIGIAEDENLEKLISKADKALYFSKENGRNCITNYEDISKRNNSY